ncbi:MAG: HypC/HybG/HupF family hydrogenase formation chaperone [Sedimentisphaerales bacterium]|nr:HypC/HybG/HupF family hydrogenase formation chaperone [Sedimentisphaerales bacterium]
MCLAVVGKVVELDGEDAIVDVRGNRVPAVIAMIPDVKISDCVLLHAGFALAVVSEQEYTRQQRFLNELDEYARKTFGRE